MIHAGAIIMAGSGMCTSPLGRKMLGFSHCRRRLSPCPLL